MAAVVGLPRRRAGAVLALAAAIALVAFLGGYVAGNRGEGAGFKALKTLNMHATDKQAAASGTIEIGRTDKHGNWPLRVVVKGLASLPAGSLLRDVPDEARQAGRRLRHLHRPGPEHDRADEPPEHGAALRRLDRHARAPGYLGAPTS